MSIYFEQRRNCLSHKALSIFILFTFLFSTIIPPQSGYAQTILNLPVPGAMVNLTPAFTPAMIKGINVYPDNPLKFDFIIDKGDSSLEDAAFKAESQRLIKYFLAALTVPEDEMWVNLSPFEKGRIIPQQFGLTEMGRDLLAQDYLLKQLSASLMYPEDELGQKFWDRVHQKAYERFGTTEIPMNTFNKVWIVPQKAKVYEHSKGAYVVSSHLGVMLEEDYLALESNQNSTKHGLGNVDENDMELITGVYAQVVREVLIPEIEKEVNEGKIFANLRQIYNSMILAVWYKQALKDSLLGKVYVDQNKTTGVDVQDPAAAQKIYDQYIEAFETGVYNYIKEDYDPATQQVIPKKYFSGGIVAGETSEEVAAREGQGTLFSGQSVKPSPEAAAAIADDGDQAMVTTELDARGVEHADEAMIISDADALEDSLTEAQKAAIADRKIGLNGDDEDRESFFISEETDLIETPAYSHEVDKTHHAVAQQRGALFKSVRQALSDLGSGEGATVKLKKIEALVDVEDGTIIVNSLLTAFAPSDDAPEEAADAFQVFLTDLLRQQLALAGEDSYRDLRQSSYQHFATRERDLRLLLDFVEKNNIQVNELYLQALKDIQRRQFTDFDKHLFVGQGNHYDVYEKMGAHVIKEGDEVVGTVFSVWAPNARQAHVEIYEESLKTLGHRMSKWENAGIWQVYIPGIEPGKRYKYAFEGAHGGKLIKKDPYGFYSEYEDDFHEGRHANIVVDRDTFTWDDDRWVEARKQTQGLDKPFSVYEMHLGSWRRHGERKNEQGEPDVLTYRELAPELAAYMTEMGYTHVELMPPTEHNIEGTGSYLPTNLFAPTSRYGTPEDFKYLINYLHKNGVGVIMDWVPAHFPGDDYGLDNFDGTKLYGHDDTRQGDHPDWGSKIPNYGRNEVKSYYLSNALYWLREFHIDGFRVDAVASMLYLDYGRQGEKGQAWVPNKYGGDGNIEAIEFIKQFNWIVHEQFPGVITIAEESTSWEGVTSPLGSGLSALGFDFKWGMGWMNDTLEFFQKEPIYRKFHHDQLTQFFSYLLAENFQLALSHDEVIHLKKSLLDKMPGDLWQKFANLRLLYGLMYATPGANLLFMGSEFGQWREWSPKESLDWHLLSEEVNPDAHYHQGVQRLVRDLNAHYKQERAWHERSYHPDGFEYIDFSDAEHGVISFLRKDAQGDEIVTVINATPEVYENYQIGLPEEGIWKEIINTDDPNYGGSGVKNHEEIQASDKGHHGQPNSFSLTIPPLAMVSFKRINEDDLGIEYWDTELKQEARRLRKGLIHYENVDKSVRTKENRAFKYLEKALTDQDDIMFKKRFGLLAKIVESKYNEGDLSAADLTYLVHELSEKHGSARQHIKQLLTELKQESNDETIREVAFKVHRWMDVGMAVFVGPEAAPWVKGGGMGSVMGEQPEALVRSGLKVYVILPRYHSIDYSKVRFTGEILQTPLGSQGFAETGLAVARNKDVKYAFLDHPHYADELYKQGASNTHNMLKSVFLSLGALEAMKALNLNPGLVVGNDWMTAILVAHLNSERSVYHNDPHFAKTKALGIDHNNGQDYQFKVPRYDDGLDLLSLLGLPAEDYGWFIDPYQLDRINMQHAFVSHSQKLFPVSPKQLEMFILTDDKGGAEGFRVRFHHKLRQGQLASVVNGVHQVEVQERRYGMSFKDLHTEEDVQQFLTKQRETQLRDREILANQYPDFWRTDDRKTDHLGEDNFVVSFMSRIAEQKGFDYAVEFVRRIMESGQYPKTTFIFAGVGDEHIENAVDWLADNYKGRVGYERRWVKDSDPDYGLIYGVPDMIASPSKFEPFGLTPVEGAIRGSYVFASRVGGQVDTLAHLGNRSGFDINLNDFEWTMQQMMADFDRAYQMWERREETDEWNQSILNNMTTDFTWKRVVDDFIAPIFQHAVTGERQYLKQIIRTSQLYKLIEHLYPPLSKEERKIYDEVAAEVAAETAALNADEAMAATSALEPQSSSVLEKGGIDLNPQEIEFEVERKDGVGWHVSVSQEMIDQLQNVTGFEPIILNIAPVMNLPMLLGVAEKVPQKKKGEGSQGLDMPMVFLDKFFIDQERLLEVA